jgi:hypothetical protein
MLEEIVRKNVIPFRYVVADTIYGGSPEYKGRPKSVTG